MKPASPLPDPVRVLSVVYFLILLLALFRSALPESLFPLGLPFLTAILSAASLWTLRGTQGTTSFMRVGFHVGMFAFLLSFPIFSPDALPDVEDRIRSLAGWTLVLSVVGFELSYWVLGAFRRPHVESTAEIAIPRSRQTVLTAMVVVGLVAWAATVVAVARALQVPIISMLLTVRGKVEGTRGSVGPLLQYVTAISGLLYFSGTGAASALLVSGRRLSGLRRRLCWSILLLCLMLGFNRGSRAFFAFSAMPLVATSWNLLAKSPRLRSLRWPFAWSAAGGIVLIWGVMSAVRGGDAREFEGGWEEVSPERHTEAALTIYTELERVVTACPDRVPFVYGDSLVAVFQGWFPRPFWPEKPYPFSTTFWLASHKKSLTEMRTSIAYSLPGEGYGNFGLFGGFLWAALFGAGCRMGDDRIASLPPSHPLRLQLSAMLGVWSAILVRGGVAEMFYLGAIPIGLSWIVCRYIPSAPPPRSEPPALEAVTWEPNTGPYPPT